MKYKRILLKLSGEALMGERQYGIDPNRLNEYAQELKLPLLLVVEIYLEELQVLLMVWIGFKETIWEC